MQIYEPENLKDQFRDLRHLQDISVVPILDRIIERLLEDLKEDPTKYGVSGVRNISQIPHSMDFSCNLIVGKEILTMTMHRLNLSLINEDPNWWMTFKIRLDGNEQLCDKVFSRFREFIGELDSKTLKEEATNILTKGKTYNLNGEMYNFYLDI